MIKKNKFNSKLIAALFFTAMLGISNTTFALAGQGFTLFGDTLDNKVTPNCYLRKEYNYFMNQWTTNEVCNPVVEQVAPKKVNIGNSNASIEGNVFLGNSPYTYSAPSYSAPVNYGFNSGSYSGFYTGNNNGYSYNNWNGYGNSANYLLSSFGGGYGSGSIGSYGYYNNYYPNSVFAYTPTSYDAYDSWYGGGSGSNYGYENDLYFSEGSLNGKYTSTIEDYSGNFGSTYCANCTFDELGAGLESDDYFY